MTSIRRREVVTRRLDWPDDVHPVLRQVLERRPLESLDELALELKALRPVGQFEALDAGVELLLKHRDAPIVIVGDFDADGATSTALMWLTLRDLGFARVGFKIPDRFADGYGLSRGLVERLAADAAELPKLIVTVDNGIGSHDGVAAARERGIDVLITDHHLPPAVLPAANVIVNPNCTGTAFGGKSLAGVGVAFYLLAALGRAAGQPAAVTRYLDLVALGTVADLVPLDQSNRILVEQGLKRIRAGQCRPGLQQLVAVAGEELASVTTASLGYKLGPRLNAAGRLDDMTIGVQCLITDSPDDARRLAVTLDQLNRDRQSIEAEMKADAIDIVDGLQLSDETLPPVICLMQSHWHEGLVGLVASRVKERYHRPSFAFAPSGSSRLKGSGRSISGFHLRDALADVAAANPSLIERFGGHAMAAGLTLAASAYDDFVAAMTAVAAKRLAPETLSREVLTDGELDAADLTLPVAALLRDALPWGQGFPEPCFDNRFELIERRVLKDAHLKLKLKPVDGGQAVDAIAFHQADVAWSAGTVRRIAYRLAVNDYYAQAKVQLIVEHVAPA
ncbi:MAG: single-stranded-DNA-specific exonuclease RecJ [Gammaproteobacteria bacterium]|nr:single-stranded-DNA-specific exonuclease RecJ [Gammaproteobacteria bacterium]